MDSISKSFALILIGIMAISCMGILMVESVSAQIMPRPSVPEFTAKVVDTKLEVTIKNQPLTPYENGSYPNLYYVFRIQNHNLGYPNWVIEPNYYVGSNSYGEYYKASDSEFTVVSLSYNFPSDQIDIQTMALVGNQVPYTDPAVQEILYKFDGENSGWSNTQTITIPTISTSPLPTINTGSLIEPFPFPLLVVASVIIAVVITLVLLFRKHRKNANLKQ
jgi:hypothetical protein